MGNLVKVRIDGYFEVPGIDIRDLPGAAYACICKLRDYEAIGFSPAELETLLGRAGEKHTVGQALRRRDDRKLAKVLDSDFLSLMCVNCVYAEKGDREGLCMSVDRDTDCYKAFVKFLGEDAGEFAKETEDKKQWLKR